jgi:hypothetical protein
LYPAATTANLINSPLGTDLNVSLGRGARRHGPHSGFGDSDIEVAKDEGRVVDGINFESSGVTIFILQLVFDRHYKVLLNGTYVQILRWLSGNLTDLNVSNDALCTTLGNL